VGLFRAMRSQMFLTGACPTQNMQSFAGVVVIRGSPVSVEPMGIILMFAAGVALALGIAVRVRIIINSRVSVAVVCVFIGVLSYC